MFRFIRMASTRRKILGCLTDEPMCTSTKGILHLKRVSSTYGIYSFHVYDKVMVAYYPNQVLPLIAGSFSDRYTASIHDIR